MQKRTFKKELQSLFIFRHQYLWQAYTVGGFIDTMLSVDENLQECSYY